MFGNQKGGLLRQNDYSPFTSYTISPATKDWFEKVKSHRCGMNVGKCQVQEDKTNGGWGITNFDIELRTADSTLDIEQLVASRAIGKALVLKAARLAYAGGLINIETFGDWGMIKEVIANLNSWTHPSETQTELMRTNAIRFIKELTPFLDDYERASCMSIIKNPVRERSHMNTTAPTEKQLSPDAVTVKRVIAIANVEAPDQQAWVRKTALMLAKSPQQIQSALEELGAKWDENIQEIVVK